jgi:hypothetical protein
MLFLAGTSQDKTSKYQKNISLSLNKTQVSNRAKNGILIALMLAAAA